MKIKIIILSVFLFAGLNVFAKTKTPNPDPIFSITDAYRFYKNIENLTLTVPTVVEVPLADEFIERTDFAVLDRTNNSFEPYYFKQEISNNEAPLSVETNLNSPDAYMMIDKDNQTFSDFLLPEDAQGQVRINLTSPYPITSSALTIILDENVALPTSIGIRASSEGQNKIVVANRPMNQTTINFPVTTSSDWQIDLNFSQPLRISELRLIQNGSANQSLRSIRFLAQPNHIYRIYLDPDRKSLAPQGESGNLVSAQDVMAIGPVSSESNPHYVIADVDGDGVPDIRDNCVSLANTDQEDANNNRRGDVCDDFDQDGIINSKDNCPDNPNLNQKDSDSDGIGDVCDKQESRLTERLPWIPWVGIGFAVLVLVILLVLTARSTRISNQSDNK